MRCSQCKLPKAAHLFGAGRRQCNPCRSATEQARYKKNAKAINARGRDFYRKNRARKRAYDKRYNVANRARITKRGNAYYHRNKARIRRYLNAWQNKYRKTLRGRISMRLSNHRRRHRIRTTSDGTVTAIALAAMWVTQRGRCALCKCRIGSEVCSHRPHHRAGTVRATHDFQRPMDSRQL